MSEPTYPGSTDPWTHAYLQARAAELADKWRGREVVVRRYFQPDVRGTMLRDTGTGAVVVAGFGVVPFAEIEAVSDE